MFLTSLAVAAAALGVSVKVYRDRKRERLYPWTVAAERMARKSAQRHQRGIRADVTSSIKRVQAKSVAFRQEIMAPFVSDTRRQQLSEVTISNVAHEMQKQKAIKRNLTISGFSLLMVSGGALFYPPLYVPGVIGTLVAYRTFFKGAIAALKEGRINVDVIISIVFVSAMAMQYFVLMALASVYGNIIRWLLLKTSNHSRSSLVNLFGETPRFVWVVVDGAEVEVPFEEVQIRDQVVIMAGQMIPVDGIISAGIASIDQHKLTGEGQPAEKSIGEQVFASTVVLSGKISVEVEKTGQDTVAAHIGEMLSATADFNLSIKSRVESFVGQVAPGLLMVSAASLPWFGLDRAAAILWSCPGYKMFVLGPMGMLNYLHLYSRQGILIKDGRSMEVLKDIDTIVFDKTGTLTEEMPQVSQIFSSHGLSQDEVLAHAAAAEYRQTHPIAKAILQAADMRQLEVPQIDDAHYEIGYGVKVNLNESLIRVGSERFMQMCGITIPASIEKEQARCHAEGYSLVYVAINEQLGGAIELRPTIRSEVKEVVRFLREKGKTVTIISGDHEAPTRRLAQELGIDHYFANTLPENKALIVRQLQEEGRSVCFIGDGINDAIALKQAHVSISLRGATTIATDTAQIVLMDGTLKRLPYVFELAEEFNQTLNSSFIMTVIPDIISIAGVFLFHWGLFTVVIFRLSCWPPLLANVMLPLYKHIESSPTSLDDMSSKQ
ncbi:MAG: heavy metal translocating P-type ATPase [Ardenticatenaceae bacterium]